MNKLKKAVASLSALATVSALGISAAAYANHPLQNFSISSYSSKWSSAATKEDGFDSGAGVHATGGTVSTNRPIYFTVYNQRRLSNINRCGSTVPLRGNTKSVTIGYTDRNIVYQGGTYYLLGETGTYSASIEGYWNP